MKKPHTLRDQWFAAALTGPHGLRAAFKDAGHPLDAETIRISTGFPSRGAGRGNKQTIGQCWDQARIKDNICQIYISPVLADPLKVLGVLVHELVHAAVGCKHGHKAPFKQAATALGLTGKMTSTTESPELVARLAVLAERLGPYPHAALDLTGRKKQTTRMIKTECEPCGYIARLSRKAIDEHGAPICPSCMDQMTADIVNE